MMLTKIIMGFVSVVVYGDNDNDTRSVEHREYTNVVDYCYHSVLLSRLFCYYLSFS